MQKWIKQLKQVLHKKRFRNGQLTYQHLLNLISHQGNENENHREIWIHSQYN